MKAVLGCAALTDRNKRPYRTNSFVLKTISAILKATADASATTTLGETTCFNSSAHPLSLFCISPSLASPDSVRVSEKELINR